MTWRWAYLSLRGRLSRESFARQCWALFFVGLAVVQLTPTRTVMGYQLNHLAGLAYALVAAWPWFALTLKRLHDSDHSVLLAIPTALALPAAYAVTLASDRGRLNFLPLNIGWTLGILIFFAWCAVLWCIYQLPSSPGANRFGAHERL